MPFNNERLALAVIVIFLPALIDIAFTQQFKVTAAVVENLPTDVHISCVSDGIVVRLNTTHGLPFNGLIYPRGLTKNSTCMTEYIDTYGMITYKMPLRSCNTMSTDVDDGVEYYNTIVVQPHRQLVTNNGRGFHIRCRYKTREKVISHGKTMNISDINANFIDGLSDIPGASMKIFVNNESYVAEDVKIGDDLILTVHLDKQSLYGMKVASCAVRDGLNWGEQPLINEHGCPVDPDIMGEMEYSSDLLSAGVSFKAHKFPYTSTVYYECDIKLCIKKNGGCDDVPPTCTSDGRNLKRKRRQTQSENSMEIKETVDGVPVDHFEDKSVTVFSGLRVEDNKADVPGELSGPSQARTAQESEVCISTYGLAIGIATAAAILMLAILCIVIFIIYRRRRRKDIGTTGGSSIYSGPYSNAGYSHRE